MSLTEWWHSRHQQSALPCHGGIARQTCPFQVANCSNPVDVFGYLITAWIYVCLGIPLMNLALLEGRPSWELSSMPSLVEVSILPFSATKSQTRQGFVYMQDLVAPHVPLSSIPMILCVMLVIFWRGFIRLLHLRRSTSKRCSRDVLLQVIIPIQSEVFKCHRKYTMSHSSIFSQWGQDSWCSQPHYWWSMQTSQGISLCLLISFHLLSIAYHCSSHHFLMLLLFWLAGASGASGSVRTWTGTSVQTDQPPQILPCHHWASPLPCCPKSPWVLSWSLIWFFSL